MPIERISGIPPGSQDLLADDVRRRRQVQAAWYGVAAERGYEEVIPPTFEYEEVFTLGAGSDLASRLIRFVDQDGRLVAMRADFTSSIARIAATKLAAVPIPLRLSYAGKVYRQTVEGAGHRREVFQLGAELIGDASPEADVEILRLVLDTLRALSIDDFQINIGEIRFIEPLLLGMGEELAEEARVAIDRRDRARLGEIIERAGAGNGSAESLRRLPDLIGRGDMLQEARKLAIGSDAVAAVDRLAAIDRRLEPAERERIVYDLGEIRGLGYYSGMRFEVFVAGAGRAVGSGGRYDRLLALYGLDRPAVGFALETDVLAELLASSRR